MHGNIIIVVYFNFLLSSYGLKQVKGVNRISGDGLETADTPGVLAGGGKWPGR